MTLSSILECTVNFIGNLRIDLGQRLTILNICYLSHEAKMEIPTLLITLFK